jgi:putative transposase
MILRPERYPWSSAAGHAGIRKDPLLSGSLEARGLVKNWVKWLRQGQDPAIVDLIRRSTRTGRPAGSAAFVTRLEALSGRRLRPKKGGRPRKDDRPKKSGRPSKGGRPRKAGRPIKGGGKRRR